MVSISLIIIFVRRFERCLKFYQKSFGLKLVRVYRGKGHPPWAEFRVGRVRLALHGGYKGPHHRQHRPLALHFRVNDIKKTSGKIKQYGGSIKFAPRKVDFRPAEMKIVYEGTFADPDGNTFDFQQLIKAFPE